MLELVCQNFPRICSNALGDKYCAPEIITGVAITTPTSGNKMADGSFVHDGSPFSKPSGSNSVSCFLFLGTGDRFVLPY